MATTMEPPKAPTGAAPKLFVRQASGLIREFSFKDAFVFNTLGYSLGLVIAVTPFFAGSVFPGVNPLLALTVGSLLVLANGLMYGLLAGAMPRSGGEYVYNGRVLHPAIGFMTNWGYSWSQILGLAIYTQWTINYAIATSLSTLGYSLDNQALLDAGAWVSKTWNTFLLSTALLAIVVVVQLAGMHVLKRVLNWLFILAMIGSVLTLIVFLMNDHSSFIDAFDSFMKRSTDTDGAYQSLLTQAKDSGWTPTVKPWWGFITALPLAYWMFSGFTYSTYIGGEVKEPQKNQTRAVLASLVVGFIFYFTMIAAYYSMVGTTFNDSAAYLQFNGESPLPVAGVLNFFAGVVTENSVVNVLIGLSFFLWHVTALFCMFTIIVRNIFAWSFDQVMPAKLTALTKGTAAPWAAVVTLAIVVEILLALFTFTTFFSFVFNIIVLFSIAFWITSFTAILMPYRRRDLFEAAPPSTRRRVLGVPLLVIAGIVNLILFTLILYVSFKFPAFSGPTGGRSIAFIVGVYLTPLVIYFCVDAYKKRRGVDLSLLYGQIPPE